MSDVVLVVRRGLHVLFVVLRHAVAPLVHVIVRRPDAPTMPERARLIAEELGLTYLKLGQFLATRYDILPTEVCRELTKLFDQVPAMPFPAVRAAAEIELGHPLEDLFAAFAETPIAAGSLAQVHEARSYQGERLAVKVQRPGIRRVLEADMRMLRVLAAVADVVIVGRVISLRSVVRDFFMWTERELDFLVEGRTADRLRAHAAPGEALPRIHWHLSTSRVLTMEMLEGLNLSQIKALLDRGGDALVQTYLPGLQLRTALRHFSSVYLRQLFVTGFFHGDPHPGNILLRGDNTVAFVDCGISGELLPAYRSVLLGYYKNLAAGNLSRSVRYYTKLTEASDTADVAGFEREVEDILRGWYRASQDPASGLQELHWGKYVNEIVVSALAHGLTLRSDYLMWARAIGMLNTNLLMFSMDFLGELRSFFAESHAELIDRFFDAGHVLRSTDAVARLVSDGPRELLTLSGHAATRRFPGRVHAIQSRATRTAIRSRQAAIAVSLLAIPAAALAIVTLRSDPAWGMVLLVATAACMTWPLVRLGRA